MGSKVNAIHSTYAIKLGLCARKTNVGAQKIDGSNLDNFEIVIVDCSVKDKLGRVRFFRKTFLLANIGLEVILGMLFLTLSKANVRFAEQEFVWKIFTAAEALPTTKKVEIIDKKKFAAAALNTDNKTFVVHVAALAEPTTMPIFSSCPSQIASLMSEKTEILIKYSNFPNIFSSDFAVELTEYIGINDHPINLLNNKQLLYGLIYSLGLMELETLKI